MNSAGLARRLYHGSIVRQGLLLVGLSLLLLAAFAFALDVEGAAPEPVSFGDTTTIGLAAEEMQLLDDRGLSVPKAQVFYSQYPYVVGFEGVERGVETLQQPGNTQQFGSPLVIYVSDYTGTNVSVTDEGYLDADGSPDWTDATRAWFVVESDAETRSGDTVVPFAAPNDADRFAERHGGEVRSWDELQQVDFDLDAAAAVRDRVERQRIDADERVAETEPLLDRQVSLTVGEDGETIQDTIDAAPAESTVVVPPGTYNENVEIAHPVTLLGEDATLHGDENGSVVTVTHESVAIAGIDIAGVGTETRLEPGADPPEYAHDDWDERVDAGYGHSDAGIVVSEAPNVTVVNVSVETPTTGILFRDSPGGVVREVSIDGTDEPMDGFMGVLSMRSPLVVQDSEVHDGRDGVYLHRADGTVVRDNTFTANRFGTHVMYSSGTLVADNVAREQTSAGLTIMTNPTANAIVGNDVQNATDGIIPGGSRSYVADNVVANNERGLSSGTTQTLYEGNTIFGNDVGVTTGSILPTNRVTGNDFVENDIHARAGAGPLRLWTEDGQGNYWQGALEAGTVTTLERSHSPTEPLQGQFHRTDGTIPLAESPAALALTGVRETSPGLRQGEIVDTAPRSEPVAPDRIDRLRAAEDDDAERGERNGE